MNIGSYLKKSGPPGPPGATGPTGPAGPQSLLYYRGYQYAEVWTNSTSYVTLASLSIPGDFTGGDCLIEVCAGCKHVNASYDADFRLLDPINAFYIFYAHLEGNTINNVHQFQAHKIRTFPSGAQTLNLQAQVNNGANTAYVRHVEISVIRIVEP